MTESLGIQSNVSSAKELTHLLKRNKGAGETNIFLPELPAMIVGKITECKDEKFIIHNFRLYKDILFWNNMKVTLSKPSTLAVIVDRIKDFFGFECFNRCILTFPSQRQYMMETHQGYERPLESEEINLREVTKIRYFRWLIGLPNSYPTKDIIVRFQLGRKLFVSYNDFNIEFTRSLDISNNTGFDPIVMFREMLFGIPDLNSLKETLINIIIQVDTQYIFLADSICKKINQYELL